MVRIHPDPPSARALFNNLGLKVKLFSFCEGVLFCVRISRTNWVMYCIVFCAGGLAWMHKLKRESYLYCFVMPWGTLPWGACALKAAGSKVIGSSE